MNAKVDKSERNWVLAWAIAIVLLASTPYLVGLIITPHGYHFLGLTHNIDDGAVYLSWMRQAADGHFFIRNLFTNEPQAARQINLLFLAMGNFARVTHLPLIWVFHIFRVLLGVGVIFAVWRFSRLFLDDPQQRRLLIPIVGLSAGIGWLIPNVKMPVGSVDMWQPEAITLLSIYLNPLFLAAIILMLGALYWLILAQRTGRARHAVCAGMSMFVLGNIHTYDVITVACVWTVYLFAIWIAERRFPARAVLLSILAAVIACPSIAYQFYLYRIDDVFRARANSPTPSPAIWSFFEGYGIILIGALIGAVYSTLRTRNSTLAPNPQSEIPNPKLFLVVWSVIGFVIPYVPIGQQRKLIMGLHVPLCILCAYGLSLLLTRLPRSLARSVILAVIIFSMGSNIRFLSHDINLLKMGGTAPSFPAFISTSELAAIRYLRENSTPTDVIFAPPAFSLFVPGLIGRQVYYGHWSETPDYGEKIRSWGALADPEYSVDEWNRLMIDKAKATYYVSELRATDPPLAAGFSRQCYSSGPVRIFRVNQSAAR
ncbi:MAG: hypothetical protein M1133_00750 [Armatimonadetes bacterium]|nr:hypothetical protein [Armatimonadota bacterium]